MGDAEGFEFVVPRCPDKSMDLVVYARHVIGPRSREKAAQAIFVDQNVTVGPDRGAKQTQRRRERIALSFDSCARVFADHLIT